MQPRTARLTLRYEVTAQQRIEDWLDPVDLLNDQRLAKPDGQFQIGRKVCVLFDIEEIKTNVNNN